MPVRITLLPSGSVVECTTGTRLFDVIRHAGFPLASACDGEALCARCIVCVLSGMEHLNSIDDEEARLLKRAGASPNERVACKTLVLGDLILTTSYW